VEYVGLEQGLNNGTTESMKNENNVSTIFVLYGVSIHRPVLFCLPIWVRLQGFTDSNVSTFNYVTRVRGLNRETFE